MLLKLRPYDWKLPLVRSRATTIPTKLMAVRTVLRPFLIKRSTRISRKAVARTAISGVTILQS